MKQNLTELKGKIENSTMIVGGFDILLSIMYKTTKRRSARKKKS